MSKNSSNARINCFLSWLEDFKKVKPKQVLKNNNTAESTILVRDTTFRSFKKRK